MKPNIDINKNIASYEIKSLFRGQLLSYMVGFYVFAFYMELHYRITALQTIRFQFTYGAIIGAICFYKFLNDNNKQGNLNSVTKAALSLLFVLGFYTVFSMDRDESIHAFSDRSVKFAMMSFFIYAATDKVEDLRVILAFMLLAWLKMGIEGFLGWYTGSLVWENQGIPRLHGSTAMYGHPNSFSGFAVGCLPFATLLLMSVKSNFLRAGLACILACALIIVVNTGSRTGYVAVIIGSVYIFFQLKTSKFKTLMIALLVIAATAIFVPDHYKERFSSIFTGQAKEGKSQDKRLEIMEDAVAIIKMYPMGIGVQAFPKVRQEIFGRDQNTHNLYLEIMTNIGPIGFIVFFVFVWHLVKLNFKNIKLLTECNFKPENQELLLTLCKALVGYVLMRLLLGLFGMDLYEIYWWVALGYTLAITKLIHRNRHPLKK